MPTSRKAPIAIPPARHENAEPDHSGYPPVEQSVDAEMEEAEREENKTRREIGRYENEGGNVPAQASAEDLKGQPDEDRAQVLAGEDEASKSLEADESDRGYLGRELGQRRWIKGNGDAVRP